MDLLFIDYMLLHFFPFLYIEQVWLSSNHVYEKEKYMSASAVKETLNPFEIAQKQVKIACDR